MLDRDMTHQRAIVDLLPKYAHRRRAGWTPLAVASEPLNLADYLLLRRVAMERTDEPISLQELQANALDPYRTIDPLLDGLPHLVQRGFLDHAAGEYMLTTMGRELLTLNERAANDYAADRYTPAPDDLEQLTTTLTDITRRQHEAPEPTVKSHQDRVPHLRRFDPRQTPPVQLEYAIYALQRARDDAHIAAWRGAGLDGPMIALLSKVWTDTTTTIDSLVAHERGRMLANTVMETVGRLADGRYILVSGPAINITPAGRDVRDRIEEETDRMYFAPWPEIDTAWIHDQIADITRQLSR